MDWKWDILVVLKVEFLMEMVAASLENAGYNVVRVSDGLEGLTKFGQHRPDLVIVDLAIGGMDAVQFCGRIRRVSALPIIVIGHLPEEEVKDQIASIRADSYVDEGAQMSDIVERVGQLLSGPKV